MTSSFPSPLLPSLTGEGLGERPLVFLSADGSGRRDEVRHRRLPARSASVHAVLSISEHYFGFLTAVCRVLNASQTAVYISIFGFLCYFSQKSSNSSLYFLFFRGKVVKNPK